MNWFTHLPPRQLRLILASAIGLSALALLWIGYRAVLEWQHAAGLVASRRASAAADLLVSALSRDMRGAHSSVLLAAERDRLAEGSTADLMHPIAGAFTRYPYAEAFFSWRNAPDEEVVFYSRVERRPSWLSGTSATAPYPVNIGSDRHVGERLLARLQTDAKQGRRFSAFSVRIGSEDYQAAAVITYDDAAHEHPVALLGYLVNLAWARAHYFGEIASQVSAIEGSDRSVRFAIVDDLDASVVGAADTEPATAPVARRMFQVAFFDPAAVALDPPPDLGLTWWTAVAEARDDPTLAAAERGASRTLAIAAVMTLTLAIGLIVSLRAARASADLAVMRADFVSAVTHELKTPLANIRAINETLVSGRTTPEMIREYARMGIGEATRLTHLVDNLLAYSRVTDVADVYSFEPISLGEAVQRSLQEFAPMLQRDAFAVSVELPDDLPPVKADPNALGLLLNNLIDNAIRYSRQSHVLTLRAHHSAAGVTLEVSDQGVGIAPDELARVTRKFFRGRNSIAGGSGLGLAIVDRIVTDHGGTLGIVSVEGQGTTVSVTIPAASHEEKVLVVEDDPVLTRVLRDNLTFEGFDVESVADGSLAQAVAREFAPDLVLLDVNLPGQSGFDLCAAWRQRSQVPIILLTAMGQKSDKVRGLQLGADDYVTKPFELEELLARIHAVLRRTRIFSSSLTLGDVVVDFAARTATRGSTELDLTHRDFEILQYLAGRPHTIVSRDELLRAVWGYPDTAATRAVDHAIARLRKKIEDKPHKPRYIHTVHGDGYYLAPDGQANIH